MAVRKNVVLLTWTSFGLRLHSYQNPPSETPKSVLNKLTPTRGGGYNYFMVWNKQKSIKAFTLAEVLVTLTIIGVVAAMTIPSLMKNWQQIQYKSAYKKAYSVAQNAYDNANREYLMVENQAGDVDSYNNNFLTFMAQFKVAKRCINTNNSECWDVDGEKFESRGPFSGSFAFIDSSGMAWTTYWSSTNNASRIFMVDTNGFQKPNIYGKDRFAFCAGDATCWYSNPISAPIKVQPFPDNNVRLCVSGKNKCYNEQNYYGTSWLYK